MSHYKDLQNRLHWLEDDSVADQYLPSGCAKITDEEAAKITAENSKLSEKDKIILQIKMIEASISQRDRDEFSIGLDGNGLREKRLNIIELRGQLQKQRDAEQPA